jgi:ankyrin repeat protein
MFDFRIRQTRARPIAQPALPGALDRSAHPGRRRAVLQLAAALLGAGIGLPAAAGSYEDFLRALRLDEPETLRRLQRLGFDFNTRDEGGQPGLLLALRSDSLRAAEFLLSQPGIDLDALSANGENALMLAALRGHVGLFKQLIGQGAEVNQPGWTPLHYAATQSDWSSVEMVALLLEHHAYIDAASPNDTTPLMMAARYGNTGTVKLLIDAGADVTLRNQQGLSARDFARTAERQDVADLINRALRAKLGPPTW